MPHNNSTKPNDVSEFEDGELFDESIQIYDEDALYSGLRLLEHEISSLHSQNLPNSNVEEIRILESLSAKFSPIATGCVNQPSTSSYSASVTSDNAPPVEIDNDALFDSIFTSIANASPNNISPENRQISTLESPPRNDFQHVAEEQLTNFSANRLPPPMLTYTSENDGACSADQRPLSTLNKNEASSGAGFWVKMQKITEESPAKRSHSSSFEYAEEGVDLVDVDDEIPVCQSPDYCEDFVISLSQCLEGKDRATPVEIPLETIENKDNDDDPVEIKDLINQYEDVRLQLKETEEGSCRKPTVSICQSVMVSHENTSDKKKDRKSVAEKPSVMASKQCTERPPSKTLSKIQRRRAAIELRLRSGPPISDADISSLKAKHQKMLGTKKAKRWITMEIVAAERIKAQGHSAEISSEARNKSRTKSKFKSPVSAVLSASDGKNESEDKEIKELNQRLETEDEELAEMQLRLDALESTLKKTGVAESKKNDSKEESEAKTTTEGVQEEDTELEEGEIRISLSELEEELESWIHPEPAKPPAEVEAPRSRDRPSLVVLKENSVRGRPGKRNTRAQRRKRKKQKEREAELTRDWDEAGVTSTGESAGRTTNSKRQEKQRERLHRWQKLQRKKILSATDPQIQLHEFYKMLTTTSFDVTSTFSNSETSMGGQRVKSAGFRNMNSLEEGSDYDIRSMDMESYEGDVSPHSDSIPEIPAPPGISSPEIYHRPYSPTDQPLAIVTTSLTNFEQIPPWSERRFQSAPSPTEGYYCQPWHLEFTPSGSLKPPGTDEIKEPGIAFENKEKNEEKNDKDNGEEEEKALRAVLLASMGKQKSKPSTASTKHSTAQKEAHSSPVAPVSLPKIVAPVPPSPSQRFVKVVSQSQTTGTAGGNSASSSPLYVNSDGSNTPELVVQGVGVAKPQRSGSFEAVTVPGGLSDKRTVIQSTQDQSQTGYKRREVVLSAKERERLALEAVIRGSSTSGSQGNSRTGSPFQPPHDLRISKPAIPGQQRMVFSTKYQLNNMANTAQTHRPLIINVEEDSSDDSDSEDPNFGLETSILTAPAHTKAKVGIMLDQFLKDAREKTDKKKEEQAALKKEEKRGKEKKLEDKSPPVENVPEISAEMRAVLEDRVKQCERDMAGHNERIKEDETRLRSLESVVRKHRADMKSCEMEARKLMDLLNKNKAKSLQHKSTITRMNSEIQSVQARLDGNKLLQSSYEQQWREIQQLVGRGKLGAQNASVASSEQKSAQTSTVQSGRKPAQFGMDKSDKLRLHKELESKKKVLEKLIKEQKSKIEPKNQIASKSGAIDKKPAAQIKARSESPSGILKRSRSANLVASESSETGGNKRKRIQEKEEPDGPRVKRRTRALGDLSVSSVSSTEDYFGVFQQWSRPKSEEKSCQASCSTSPLLMLKAYRLTSSFRNVEKLCLASKSFAHKMNPFQALCNYALLGECADDQCLGQHEKGYSLSNVESVAELGAYYPEALGIESDSPTQDEILSKAEEFLNKFKVDLEKGTWKLENILIYLQYVIQKKMKAKQKKLDLSGERVWKPVSSSSHNKTEENCSVPTYSLILTQDEAMMELNNRYFSR